MTLTPPTVFVDTIIEARWVIPIEPANVTLSDYAVILHQGKIQDLLPISESRQKYQTNNCVELSEHVLIPGLINLHSHAAMNLLRGIADDLPLMRWLTEAIWPLEQKHVSEQFVFDGTLLAAAEMLQSGITCTNDMYFYPHEAARAFETLGIRAIVGITVIDFPTNYASDHSDYLHKGLLARDQWKDHSLISFSMAPHAPYTVSDIAFEQIASLAEELDITINLHLNETLQEHSDSLQKYKLSPLNRLKRLGILGPNLIVAHAIHVNDEEIALLAEHQVSVAHNPTSNMKLASGIAPIKKMLDAGVTVGLGSDGAASNNRLDIFQEMRHAALLAKVTTGDASAVSAHQALRMATLHGAQALGQEQRIGSISIGKEADLCAISLNTTHCTPCYDPASHLIYVAGREHVTDTWVAGRRCVKNRVLLHSHNTELLRLSRMWQNRLKA